MLTKRVAVLFAIIFAFSLAAGEPQPWSITRSHGPTTGGTTVTIKGDLNSNFSYEVIFGNRWTETPSYRDATTLVVKTPSHLPGEVEVSLFEYDIHLATPLKFTYEGEIPREAFARILLPVFVPPVQGAFGSEFRTELRAGSAYYGAYLFGVQEKCLIAFCAGPQNEASIVYNRDADLEPNGTPGRFIYVPREDVDKLTLALRAFDVSREATNYGTAIPVVDFDAAGRYSISLPAVPTDPRFRNTLRIYSDVPQGVSINAGDRQYDLELTGAGSIYEPAMTTWTGFPSGVGPIQVKISAMYVGNPGIPLGKIWALLTVTNNDTQAITTITP